MQLSSLVRFLEHPVQRLPAGAAGLLCGGHPRPSLRRPAGRDEPAGALGARGPAARGPAGRAPIVDKAIAAERGRGLLPPGPLGDAALAEVKAVVEALVAEVETLPCGRAAPVPVEVNIALPGGRSLVGTVPGVRDGTVLRCTYSKLGPSTACRAWAQFLALSAAHPRDGAVGRDDRASRGELTGAVPASASAPSAPLAESPEALRSAAFEMLEVLVDLYERGMREPLPIYCATSAAWAQAAGGTTTPANAPVAVASSVGRVPRRGLRARAPRRPRRRPSLRGNC